MTDLAGKSMCPHCGKLFRSVLSNGLIPRHTIEVNDIESCPGSGQNPRNPESDMRLLWNGEPNPHVERPAPREIEEPSEVPGLHFDCDRCNRPLAEPGALAIGPPSPGLIMVTKRHICVHCWFDFCGWMEQGSDR